MSQLRFDGRVAIVTGGGRGLGRSHAKLLASRGASVVVNDNGAALDGSGGSEDPAKSVVEEILAAGGGAVADTNSVASAEGGEAIVAHALEAFGRVDIVINNAGILRDKAFHNMTHEMWDAVQGTHLRGAFNVAFSGKHQLGALIAFGISKRNGNGILASLWMILLGVSGIWLMPIAASPSYHGYDVVDYYGVNPDYGTLDDFQAFLEEAHRRELFDAHAAATRRHCWDRRQEHERCNQSECR